MISENKTMAYHRLSSEEVGRSNIELCKGNILICTKYIPNLPTLLNIPRPKYSATTANPSGDLCNYRNSE